MNEILKKMHEVAASPRAQMDKYLAEGKKIVLCAPVYTPEEIIHSMGFVPMGAWGGDMELNRAKEYCPAFLCAIVQSLLELGITGMTMSHVLGCGIQKGKPEYYRGVEVEPTLLPKIQLDIVVSKVPVRSVIETAKKVLYTGDIGDGKIFVYDVENVVKVRTGEEGYDALQDVE